MAASSNAPPGLPFHLGGLVKMPKTLLTKLQPEALDEKSRASKKNIYLFIIK